MIIISKETGDRNIYEENLKKNETNKMFAEKS